jgi:DNA-binding HxlR family transcriptional regulator
MDDRFEGLYALFNLKHSMDALSLLVDNGECRFSEIERRIDASSDVTTRVLEKLCELGLVCRREMNPRTVYYEVTTQGEEFYRDARDLEGQLCQE